MLGILLAGLGHVLRIPADLRANRLFHLAWLGQKERYVDGVNRAAVFILIVPALLALFPAQAVLFGLPMAAAHALTGLLLGDGRARSARGRTRARCRSPTATTRRPT